MNKASPIVAVLDIETLGTRVNSKIASIGIVVGNILTGEVKDEFYVVIDTDGQTNRTVTESTLAFWEKQQIESPQAYAELFGDHVARIPLTDALADMNNFLSTINTQLANPRRKVNLFGNGPEFDNAIISDAMADLDLSPQWHYAGNQSIRTAVFFERLLTGNDSKYAEPLAGKHHALEDARHEFEYLCAITRNLSNINKGV